MKFVKSNWLILLIMLGAVCNEYLDEPFKGIEHSKGINSGKEVYTIYLDTVVYYAMHQLFVLGILIAYFFKIDKVKISARALMFGVIFWFIIEFIEITCALAKINDNWLVINDNSWLQISSTITIILAAKFGFTKYKL